MQTLKLTKKYETYPEYKDSGVEWLGKIPKEWESQKIVSVFDFPHDKVTEENYEPLSVTYDGIKKQIENAAKVAEGSLRKHVKIGDIAINGRSDRKGAVGMSEYEGGVSLVYNVLRKRNSDFNSKYFHYLFRSNLFSEEFYRWGRGIVDDLWTTRESEMKRIFITVPKPEDQSKIASYLDEKTIYIDQIIEKKQKQIELLKERRTAMINQAVTKGLDQKVKFKESGVNGIGKIPEGWSVQKMKFLAKKPLQYGANEAGLNDDPSQPRFIRITDIDENGNLRQDIFKSLDLDLARPYLLEEGDILFARTGGTVGKSFKYKKEWGPCCYAGYLIRMNVNQKKISSDYLEYITKSDYYWKWIDSIFIRSTIQNVSAEKYKDFLVMLPPIIEQKNIVNYLNTRIPLYEKALQQAEKSIEILQEFKSSLISSVVTGKVKI